MSIHQIYSGEESIKNRTYVIDDIEQALETYHNMVSESILLVILSPINVLANADTLLKRANDMCLDMEGEIPRKVLWMHSDEIQEALQAVFEEKLSEFSSELKLEDYLGFSVVPKLGTIAQPIEKLSNLRIDLAFAKAELEMHPDQSFLILFYMIYTSGKLTLCILFCLITVASFSQTYIQLNEERLSGKTIPIPATGPAIIDINSIIRIQVDRSEVERKMFSLQGVASSDERLDQLQQPERSTQNGKPDHVFTRWQPTKWG